jgi:uncharacterized membrane protein
MKDEQGQVLPLAAGVVVLAAAAMLLVVHLGRAANERARARTAADAAALAGAAEGRDAAEAIAIANHAVIETYVEVADGVELRVRVGAARATARAVSTNEPCSTRPEAHPVHFERCPPTPRAQARPRT